MRFTAPEHVADAHLSIGVISVVDGVLELPDDAPQSDIDGLRANGFQPDQHVAAPAKGGKAADPIKAD